MKLFARIALALTLLLALVSLASAQSWQPLTNQPPIGPGVMLQLRDGRILVAQDDTGVWEVLTPDITGSYVNGTWSSAGTTATFNYGPLYYGSQVLMDGQTVVIEGGEYNFGSAVWTTQGARLTYSGGSFTWVPNSPPPTWGSIGDAQSVILPDGRYMQANCCSTQSAIYLGPNSWGPDIFSAGVDNDEGAYTLLQNGKVLMVDAWSTGCSSFNSSELFDPTSNTWTCGPNTTAQLWDNAGHELGPNVVLHNGKTFQMGATNNTSVYNPVTNSWAVGPIPAGGLTGYDAPASLEPNGKVLEMVAPPGFAPGCQFMEYDPSTNTLANTANPPSCPGDQSYIGHLMVLPTGQIMFTDFGSGPTVVYNFSGSVDPVAKPTILAASTSLKAGSVNNLLYGKQLNGLGQNNAYGDDYQGDTDFPLVRLTCVGGGNCTVGNVYYTLTHNESTHSIAPGTIMYTKFDIPSTVPPGKYQLQSVANGIGSNSVIVSVK